jgi:hypothetical protein
VPADQPPVPAQPRVRRYELAQPQRLREQPGQEARIARSARAEQRHPAGQADEDQVEHPYCHKPGMLTAWPPTQQKNPQVSNPCSGFGTYGVVSRHGAGGLDATAQATHERAQLRIRGLPAVALA